MVVAGLPWHKRVCRYVNLYNFPCVTTLAPRDCFGGGEKSWLGDMSHKGLGSTAALWKLV